VKRPDSFAKLFLAELKRRRIPVLAQRDDDCYVISVVGVATMIGAAALIAWYKRADERRPGARQKPANADFAGGEA